jgi:hypothetical protein
MALEFFLPASQGYLIGLDLVEAPAGFPSVSVRPCHDARRVQLGRPSSFALHALHVPNFAISMQPGERRKM